ncbi:molybdopterin cofactor-binding domain-containing protein [Oxalobacteraceae bacterium A2-2]
MADGAVKGSRRRFILSGVAGAGALLVGWGVYPARQRLHGSRPLPLRDGAIQLNGWVAIAPDGTVSIAVPRSEMGQGVHTALPMLVAEELDVPLSAVRVVQAPPDHIYGNVAVIQDGLPFHPDDQGRLKAATLWTLGKVAREMGLSLTGGSTSIKDAWQPMREAGATARAQLVAAAAQAWKVAPAACRTEAGHVIYGQRRASYGSLAAQAVGAAPGEVVLKAPADFRLIGQPVARLDTPSKVNGSAVFGIDVRLPGMLYAAVRMSPIIGGTLAGMDAAPVLKMPGVQRVMDFSSALIPNAGAGAGVAVVASTWWQAKSAAQALELSWAEGANGRLASDAVWKELAAAMERDSGHVYHAVGDVEAVQGAARAVSAEYRAPFLAHAAMEPISCTAQVVNGKCHVWAATQSPTFAIQAAARAAGVPESEVELTVTLLGGGFGRRLEVDMVAQAVAIARQCAGAPVQMIWSREDDLAHDVYRPAALARYSALLDGAGAVLAYVCKAASGSVSQHFGRRYLALPVAGPEKALAEGQFDHPYEFPSQRLSYLVVDSAVPLGNWRSVGHSHNAFFKECFIDELAHAAGQDGAAYRRGLLRRHPRQLAVLDAALARAGSAPEGRAHGVALHQSYGTIVAQVAEVSVQGREIRVHRVVCALDCGIAVNPSLIAQQVESSVVFGLSAALYGNISIRDGKVEQSNFHDYPVLRLAQAPEVETVILPSDQPPEGMGEPAVPPLAPAVANAVFKLTGQRLRSLPLVLS